MTLHTLRSCILGHAVADALGVPVEFNPRPSLDRHSVTDMRGFGTYAVPAGSWSDDTSMTLCALDALAEKEFSWDTVMKNFGRWYYESAYTPTGEMFDVGNACRVAIERYCVGKVSLDECGGRGENSNGNGSLMRIIPFALLSPGDTDFIEKASSLTHAHRRSQMACGIYAFLLRALARARDVNVWSTAIAKAAAHYGAESEWKHFAPLADIASRTRESIRSSGYVVDTLEAALWCLVTTDSYRDCVLKAVNLGEDTDTVAAVAGGLAGAVYGVEAIPQEWLDTLLKKEYIEELCSKAWERWEKR